MPVYLKLLIASAVLNFAMILVSAVLSARLYTPAGFLWASGNRERPLADDAPPPVAGRADRAAKNMSENMVLFTPVLLAAHAGGADPATLTLGAQIFFGARVLYWPTYLVGVPFLRTALWGVSLVGVFMIAATAL